MMKDRREEETKSKVIVGLLALGLWRLEGWTVARGVDVMGWDRV